MYGMLFVSLVFVSFALMKSFVCVAVVASAAAADVVAVADAVAATGAVAALLSIRYPPSHPSHNDGKPRVSHAFSLR